MDNLREKSSPSYSRGRYFPKPGQNVLNYEVLVEIVIPLPSGKYGAVYAKMTRTSTDLAKINCAVPLGTDHDKCNYIRIVLGAVADRAVRTRKVEQQLKDLEMTINKTDCDAVVVATPIDLSRIIDIRRSSTRVYYELREIGMPNLNEILSEFGKAHNLPMKEKA